MAQPQKLFFTFPDNTLGYECRGCAACCKGLGVGLDAMAGEHRSLAAHYPGLTSFLQSKGGAWSARNPRGACWFLRDDGLCRVEVDHGRDSKPGACRLFPFNRVFRLGELTIVDFNSVICPLQIVDEGDEVLSGPVRHTDIALEIASISDRALIGTVLPSNDPAADAKRFASREERIARSCFTEARQEEPDMDAVLAEKLPRRTRPALLRCSVDPAFEFIVGASPSLPSRDTLARALVLTPSLRFNERYGPRQYDEGDAILTALPGMWLAWLYFAAQAEVLAEQTLSIQQLTSVWVDQAALSYAMARWSDKARLEPGPVDLPDDPILRPALVALGNNAASKGNTLGQLMTSAAKHLEPMERVVFVRASEPILKRLAFATR